MARRGIEAPEYTSTAPCGTTLGSFRGCCPGRGHAQVATLSRHTLRKPTTMPGLTISTDSAFAIVEKARQYAVKVPQTDPDSGSNPTDDTSIDALEFGAGDDTRRELIGAIDDLNDDEQIDLVALVLLGRGDFAMNEWADARDAAAEVDRAHIGEFIATIPLVSDYLEDGLSQFGETMGDWLKRN
jgi:hypothetical protein